MPRFPSPPPDIYVKPAEGGYCIAIDGLTRLPDKEGGARVVKYEIEITQSGLDALVARAASNKGRKAVDGPITARIIH